MPNDLKAIAGWTLDEAARLTVNRDVLAAFAAADKAWLGAGAQQRLVTLSSYVAGEEATAINADTREKIGLRNAKVAAESRVLSELQSHLRTGRLVAWGRRGSPLAGLQAIPSSGWDALSFGAVYPAVLTEMTSAKTQIFDVRVYPIIHSDDAATRLSECSIVEAFQKCVRQDPEFAAASKLIRDRSRFESLIKDGNYPAFTSHCRWPLDVTTKDLASDFVDPGYYIPGMDLPKVTPDVERAASIVVDRWQRLRQRLVNGELLAQGTYASSGEHRPIDRFQWARAGVVLDVASGDFLELESQKYVVRWSGISLVRGSIGSGLLNTDKATPTGVVPPKRIKRSPKAEAVAVALRAHGLEHDPCGLSWVQITARIAGDMPEPPKTASANQALAKAVERHYERISRGGK